MSPLSNSNRPKVVLTCDLGPDIMPLLHERKDIELVAWTKSTSCDRDWLLRNAVGATALIVLVTNKIDQELLDAAGPKLRVVSTMSVGYDHCNIQEIAKRQIKLGYTPDVLTDAVADISIMLALMAGRNARETMAIVNEGKWSSYTWAPFLFCGPQLSTTPSHPKRIAGFVGFGRIAHATLARLIPFGFTQCVYFSNPSSTPNLSRDASLAASLRLAPGSIRRVNLATVAEESDVLFVLTPGGKETNNLVDELFLRKMKKTSVLVNTSRGSVVDSDALAKALREGWIWAAGLDVVAGEPNILIDHPLVREPRCAILPHIGSATLETRIDMATLVVKNALAVIDGEEMPACLDLSHLTRM